MPDNEKAIRAAIVQRDSCAHLAVMYLTHPEVADSVRVELATQAAIRSASYQATIDQLERGL